MLRRLFTGVIVMVNKIGSRTLDVLTRGSNVVSVPHFVYIYKLDVLTRDSNAVRFPHLLP